MFCTALVPGSFSLHHPQDARRGSRGAAGCCPGCCPWPWHDRKPLAPTAGSGREAQPQPQEGAARGTSAGTGSGCQQPPAPGNPSPSLLRNTWPGGWKREEMRLRSVG